MFVVYVPSVKAKRHYEKSHRESEKALEAYRKSDADIHLSRADVEKVSACFDSVQKCTNMCIMYKYVCNSVYEISEFCVHAMKKVSCKM